MIKDYDELHKEREESQKGSIEMDEASLKNLAKQQQARYKAMVEEIKAKKLQADPNVYFDEIKQTNEEAMSLFQKVISKPENMDVRFDISELMRYMSYTYEEFYKSMKSSRDADKSEEHAKKWNEEHPDKADKDVTRWSKYDRERAQNEINNSKEYLERVKKMIKEIEDKLK